MITIEITIILYLIIGLLFSLYARHIVYRHQFPLKVYMFLILTWAYIVAQITVESVNELLKKEL